MNQIREKIVQRKAQLNEIQESLPRKNDLYLRIILDGINVSFINQEQRFKFKEQYEKFKLVVSGLILFVAVLDFMVTKYRFVHWRPHVLPINNDTIQHTERSMPSCTSCWSGITAH